MLTRQRVVLALLNEAGGSLTHLEVTKLTFLLREETPSRGGSAFFQFLPYRHGPFSFCLYQEIAALVRDCYLCAVDERRWAVTADGVAAGRILCADLTRDIRWTVKTVYTANTTKLLDHVYDHYRWYTINSIKDPRMERPVNSPAVYTAGYEGLSIDGFLNGLLRNGIRALIDVRNNPVSRRYGFHRSTLKRLSENVGIDYHHFPSLGIPPAERRDIDVSAARNALFEQYRKTTLFSSRSDVTRAGNILSKAAGVLVCMEADHRQCHRCKLADAIADQTGMPIHHLELRQ